jgi:hypothetical protein
VKEENKWKDQKVLLLNSVVKFTSIWKRIGIKKKKSRSGKKDKNM